MSECCCCCCCELEIYVHLDHELSSVVFVFPLRSAHQLFGCTVVTSMLSQRSHSSFRVGVANATTTTESPRKFTTPRTTGYFAKRRQFRERKQYKNRLFWISICILICSLLLSAFAVSSLYLGWFQPPTAPCDSVSRNQQHQTPLKTMYSGVLCVCVVCCVNVCVYGLSTNNRMGVSPLYRERDFTVNQRTTKPKANL